jgi:hypothetical protein
MAKTTKTIAGSRGSGKASDDDETAFEDMYGSKYLSASDVKKPTASEIESVGREVFDRPGRTSEAKATLNLKGFLKPAVLNKTNANALAEAFGKAMARDWPGKPVLVKVEQTSFQGKPTKGVRIYPRDPDDMRGDAIGY